MGCAAAHAQPKSAPPSRNEELLAALSSARARGCEGQAGIAAGLRPVPALAEASRRMAQGQPAAEAVKRAGYRATRVYQVQMTGYGSTAAMVQAMVRQFCKPLADPRLTDAGMHAEGGSYWLVLAAPFTPPPPSAAPEVAQRVLALTNQARAQPRNCGADYFNAARALRLNSLLTQAAAVHAQDMARHGYLEHRGRDGSDFAERITRAGYHWRSVAENVASGQSTAEQVVQEWLRSPGHCANLMNPVFIDMGVAYGVNAGSEAGIYWAQEFGRPR